METIKAFILNVRKNTGNTVIIDCYTKEKGRLAVVHSISKSNKRHRALLFPLSWVSFAISGKKSASLKRLNHLQALSINQSIGLHPVKNLVVLFLSEIISSCIREEHPDSDLYLFFENAFHYYDTSNDDFSNFHLVFLTSLLALLGIAPPVDSDQVTDTHYAMWENKMSALERDSFKTICLTPINQSQNISLSSSQRSRQLNIILDYYQHFAPGFRMPKSLELFRDF